MDRKKMIWMGLFIGSLFGGYIPSLWGGDIASSLIWSGIGAFAGIWLGYRIGG